MNPLDDQDLDRALQRVEPPAAPAQLEARTLAAYRSEFGRMNGWRRLFTMRVTVPLPVAAAVVAALMCLSVLLARVERQEHRQAPAQSAVSADSQELPWGGFQPVGQLRPVIIRSQHENR